MPCMNFYFIVLSSPALPKKFSETQFIIVNRKLFLFASQVLLKYHLRRGEKDRLLNTLFDTYFYQGVSEIISRFFDSI